MYTPDRKEGHSTPTSLLRTQLLVPAEISVDVCLMGMAPIYWTFRKTECPIRTEACFVVPQIQSGISQNHPSPSQGMSFQPFRPKRRLKGKVKNLKAFLKILKTLPCPGFRSHLQWTLLRGYDITHPICSHSGAAVR